ncbi:unnamed protein product, partial [Musa acuminata subsp. burmannicoides]
QHGIRVNCISSFGYATGLACEFMRMEGKQIEQLIGGMANLKGRRVRVRQRPQPRHRRRVHHRQQRF